MKKLFGLVVFVAILFASVNILTACEITPEWTEISDAPFNKRAPSWFGNYQNNDFLFAYFDFERREYYSYSNNINFVNETSPAEDCFIPVCNNITASTELITSDFRTDRYFNVWIDLWFPQDVYLPVDTTVGLIYSEYDNPSLGTWEPSSYTIPGSYGEPPDRFEADGGHWRGLQVLSNRWKQPKYAKFNFTQAVDDRDKTKGKPYGPGNEISRMYIGVVASPIPEPATLLLLGSSLIGVIGFKKIKKRT